MTFTQAKGLPYIAIIKTEDELDAFIDRAGVAQRYRDLTCKMYNTLGRLSLTNSKTGEYCLAYKYVPRLMEQAI